MFIKLKDNCNIQRRDYGYLLDWCFGHACFFAIRDYTEGSYSAECCAFLEKLSPHLIIKHERVYYPGYSEYVGRDRIPQTYWYACCEENHTMLLAADSIYTKLFGVLGDLQFYRRDQTTLLYISIGKSICWISCTPEEYAQLSAKERWEIIDSDYIVGDNDIWM